MAVQSVALLPKHEDTYRSHGIVRYSCTEYRCSRTCTDAAHAAQLVLSTNRTSSSTVAILYGSFSVQGRLVDQATAVLEQLFSIQCCTAGQPATAAGQACWLASAGAWQLQEQDASPDSSFSFTPALNAATEASGQSNQCSSQPLQCQVSILEVHDARILSHCNLLLCSHYTCVTQL